MTKLLYLENMWLLESPATVVDVLKENDRDVVILDQTIFYPQGGGQPYDKGVIKSDESVFNVEEVRFTDGLVKHIGTFEKDTLKNGDKVTCYVEKERRELHTRIHSAGHIVDMALQNMKIMWTPGKGFHFPEGPYDEYSGSLENIDKEQFAKDLENECNRIIAEGRQTTVRFMPKEKMHEVCHFVPDYLPEGKPTRVVMYGDFGIPCGGTHVAQLSDIKQMSIRKVKQRGEAIRIAYDVVRTTAS